MTDTADALFDMDPVPRPEPAEKLSPDRRRTIRQHAAVARGVHPLALLFGPRIRVTDDPGRSCGNCRFRRTTTGEHAGAFPKCWFLEGARITGSAASDVRAWWPGCTDHEWGDSAVSGDAARWVPDGVV